MLVLFVFKFIVLFFQIFSYVLCSVVLRMIEHSKMLVLLIRKSEETGEELH